MNPFRLLDDLLGPLDAISVAAGTARMLAHGQLATECIAIRRPGQKTGVAVLLDAGIIAYDDTYNSDWFCYRVAAGDGKRAVQLLKSRGIDATVASQARGQR